MIQRTKKEKMYELLEKHPEWKILDLASSNAGWKQANVYCDVKNFSDYYNKKYNNTKQFIQCNVEDLNKHFKDKEFDFVIASHILEHVNDPFEFCKELTRITNKGYIEVPTPLYDNFLSEPYDVPFGHKWWVTFDDYDKNIIINKKINVFKNCLSINESNRHMMFFRDSAITMLYWENDIPIIKGDGIYNYNDNRDLNMTFDSNTIDDWNGKFMFHFGSIK